MVSLLQVNLIMSCIQMENMGKRTRQYQIFTSRYQNLRKFNNTYSFRLIFKHSIQLLIRIKCRISLRTRGMLLASVNSKACLKIAYVLDSRGISQQ